MQPVIILDFIDLLHIQLGQTSHCLLIEISWLQFDSSGSHTTLLYFLQFSIYSSCASPAVWEDLQGSRIWSLPEQIEMYCTCSAQQWGYPAAQRSHVVLTWLQSSPRRAHTYTTELLLQFFSERIRVRVRLEFKGYIKNIVCWKCSSA